MSEYEDGYHDALKSVTQMLEAELKERKRQYDQVPPFLGDSEQVTSIALLEDLIKRVKS